MFRRRCIAYLVLFFMVFAISGVVCAADSALSPFIGVTEGQDRENSVKREDVRKGWYWYKKEKKPREDEKEKEEKSPRRVDPWTMPAKDFREMLNNALDVAVTEPTVENVLRYVELQDIARKKALAFTNVFQLVVQENPQYNTMSQSPVITPGRKALVVMRREEVSACINDAAADFALIYFYKPDCRFCAVQRRILAFFTDNNPWMVKKVNIYEDPGAALRFNVATVPYIMLVSRETGEYMPISVGVVSLDDFKNRLCRTVRLMRHEISPEQFSLYDFQKGGAGDPTTKGIYRFFNEAKYGKKDTK